MIPRDALARSTSLLIALTLACSTPSPAEAPAAAPVAEAAPVTAAASEPVAAPARPALVPERLADAVLLGDCARALALVPADPSPAERLVQAHCHLALDRPEAVIALPTIEGPLAAYGQWMRARAFEALDRPEDAVAALADVDLPGENGLRLRSTRARLAGDRAALLALSDTAVGAEARYHAALLAPEGERDQALRRIWAEAAPPWDDRAVEALGGAPSLASADGKALARARIEALRKRYRHEEALALLEETLADAPPATPEARLDLARARFAARAWDRAIESWQAALGPPDRAAGAANDLFDYALTFARTGDYDTAAIVYRRLIAAHPSHARADFASFKLGYMAYDRGDCAAAVPLLERHVADRPDSKHLDEALWFEARCHWKAGELEPALAAWQALVARRPSSSLAPGALYWSARAAGRRGDAEAERAGLAEVLRRHPTSGYAWFAAEALDTPFPTREIASAPAWPAALEADPHVQRARALLAVGLRPLAQAELAEVTASDRAGRLALAWARLDAGDVRGAQQLARADCVSPWKGGDPVAQQVCWPRPERALVAQVVAAHPLDPLLPYAIMSAESALDPSVTSPAGARGLMQLMPDVAKGLHAEVFADDRFDDERLYWGPYNATLGTWELGRRARSLQGVLDGSDLPAVIASYNGGEEAVRRWVAAYDQPPAPDEFAEDVGYVETRQYVKRVLGELMAWRWVYGDPG